MPRLSKFFHSILLLFFDIYHFGENFWGYSEKTNVKRMECECKQFCLKKEPSYIFFTLLYFSCTNLTLPWLEFSEKVFHIKKLTYSSPMVHFYRLRKHQKIKCYLTFPGVVKLEHFLLIFLKAIRLSFSKYLVFSYSFQNYF